MDIIPIRNTVKDGVADVNAGKQSHFLDRTEVNQN
jgi:hypothetical protein